MTQKFTRLLLLIGLAAFVIAPAAQADTITLTLASPNQAAAPGDTIDFTATATAPSSNSATEYFNSDSFNQDAGLTIDDTGFWNNFFSVDPGTNLTDVLFSVTVDPSAGPGTLYGHFEILGGADGGNYVDFNQLAQVDYSINVTTVPEPASILLLGSGIMAGIMRKRYPNKK